VLLCRFEKGEVETQRETCRGFERDFLRTWGEEGKEKET